jgi:hypothetical protein
VKPNRISLAALVVVVAVFLAACASDGTDRSGVAADDGAVFVLSEWKIKAPSGQLQPGSQRITAKNVGGEDHELVIVSAASADELPTNADGSVDEDKLASATVGETGDVAPGSSKTKTFALPRGTYVAFCNLVDQMGSGGSMGSGHMGSGNARGMDHVHFALGMSTTFTVG